MKMLSRLYLYISSIHSIRLKNVLLRSRWIKLFIFLVTFPIRLVAYLLTCVLTLNQSNTLFLEALSKKKKSNRVYILGSGASINNITSWDEIAKYDSIGFNFWLLHSFVPSFYFFEGSANSLIFRNLIGALVIRLNEYSNTLLVCNRGPCVDYHCIQTVLGDVTASSILNYKPFAINAPTVRLYRFSIYLCELIERCFSFLFDKFMLTYESGSSSVERLVNLCIKLGYSEIILCGIDLNNNKYFYSDKAGLSKLIPDSYHPLSSAKSDESVQKTDDKSVPRRGLIVSDAFYALLPFLARNGVRLYVESPNSRLANMFPVFKH